MARAAYRDPLRCKGAARESAATKGGPMRLAGLLGGFLCTVVIVCGAVPAHAEEAEQETCVGKVRLRGPIWDLQSGTLEPGLEQIFDAGAEAIREHCAQHSIVIEAHAF